MALTADLEKRLQQKDEMVQRRENGTKREQAQQLRYQKVARRLHQERNAELVDRDHDGDKQVAFDSVYKKLMGDPDDEELEERYVGKKKLAVEASLNGLKHI